MNIIKIKYLSILTLFFIGFTNASAQTIVDVQVQELEGNSHTNEYVTFGHVFKKGDVSAGNNLIAELDNGIEVVLQINEKSTHTDSSLKHAILSLKLDNINANELKNINLKIGQSSLTGSNLQLTDLMNTGFTSSVDLDIAGTNYTASLSDGITEGNVQNWLEGPLAAEWLVRASVKDSNGIAHPHLTVRFNVRTYLGFSKTKVDVVVENNWSYVSDPQDFTYDVSINITAQTVYNKTALEHYHHARWKKTFWDNGSLGLDVIFDAAYLMQTRALPNYDQSLQITETTLANLENEFSASNTEPMGINLFNPYMPAPGGRPDIGPETKWSSLYLLSMDKRAKDGIMTIGDSGGSWSIHYRDQNTDLPVTVLDYPYASIAASGWSSTNPDTGQNEKLLDCAGNCNSPYTPDIAHQPSFAYVPYLVTGDYFYLEELMFWANYNIIWSNPYYRNQEEGLFKSYQIRGQAWSLRTLGQAAYITPDNHLLKDYFNDIVNHNLNYYNNRYLVDTTTMNPLGFVTESYAFPYDGGRGHTAWMDDLFTWSIGYLKALDFQTADSLLEWKVTSCIERMTNQDYCWILGMPYSLIVRDSSTDPLYTTFAEVYDATVNLKYPAVVGLECGSQAMADALGFSLGQTNGGSTDPEGYTANIQSALAVATETTNPNAALAWQVFENRSVKPNYASSPQFAIVPFESTTLSINDEIFNNSISIIPNPTTNTFSIDLKDETLEKVIIYNQLGQQVKDLSANKAGVTTKQIDISNLSNGIYFVKITSQSGKTATKKIIKN